MSVLHRAEHVGSLLRPSQLLEARNSFAQGALSLEQLRSVEDDAIRDALKRQHGIGLGILSDGEMRRASWLTDMSDAVEGFVPHRVELEWKGPGGGREGSTAMAAGTKLRKLRKMTGHELPILQSSSPGPFKVTLPAPSNFMVASYKPGISDKVYSAPAEFLVDVVEIVKDEIRWLVSEGVTYIQLDAPFYSHFLDPAQRRRMIDSGHDPDREFDEGVRADNACFEGLPRQEVTVALHVCRGNSRSRWYTEGAYDVIAERLFGTLDVDTFLLEYDTERAGTFQPLRLVPRGKNVVLGLVTTKEPRLESTDDLRRRIDGAAQYIPLEYLALSPQCGFASIASGNLISMDDQWRKLELVVETARKVWG